MQIPQSFKTTISNTFYDKEFIVYSQESEVASDGFVRKGILAESSTFMGNAHFDKFNNFSEVQKDYGLLEQIDMLVSCENGLATGTLIGYLDEVFKVVKSIPHDSHYILLCQKRLLKSPTLPSV